MAITTLDVVTAPWSQEHSVCQDRHRRRRRLQIASGPWVEGHAGIHHHPSPARRVRKLPSAGQLSGSRWPLWASIPTGAPIALPLQAQLYIRAIDDALARSLPNGDRPSAPNWNWPGCSKCSGWNLLGRQPCFPRNAVAVETMVAIARGRFLRPVILWTARVGAQLPAQGRFTRAVTCCRPNGSRASGGDRCRPTARTGSIWTQMAAGHRGKTGSVGGVRAVLGERVTKTIKTLPGDVANQPGV